MNNIPDTLQRALLPFAPPTRLKAGDIPSPRLVAVLGPRESANDEPEYIRTPELDKRITAGDGCDSNAWHEVATGRSVTFFRGYDANAHRWLRLTDVEGRNAIDLAVHQGTDPTRS